jgi:hypothetical protein
MDAERKGTSIVTLFSEIFGWCVVVQNDRLAGASMCQANCNLGLGLRPTARCYHPNLGGLE